MRRVPGRGIGEGVGLALALLFVFSMQYIPHLDTFSDPPPEDDPALVGLARSSFEYVSGEREGYPYTIHADENVHWAEAAGTQRHDQVFVSYPTGAGDERKGIFSLRGAIHERGFTLILAEAQELTGVSFQRIFQFLPAIWMTFIAFSIYAVLRPSPAALPAAALVALNPTTPRFLGTGILVPIAFVLAWLPAILILRKPAKRRGATALLLIAMVTWAFFVHLIGGFAAVGLVAIVALFSAGEDRASALRYGALALLPILWLWRTFSADIQRESSVEEFLPIDWSIFDQFGFYMLFVWAFGLAALAIDPPKQRRVEHYALAAFSVGALALIVGGVYFELDRYATYARWHPPFFLAASVPAAYGLVTVGRWARRAILEASRALDTLHDTRFTRAGAMSIAILLTGALLLVTVSQPVGHHLRQPYYHVMDDEAWARYNTVADSIGPEYQVVLTHPWQAPVLAAMTGIEPYTWLGPGSPPVNGEQYDRFRNTGGSLELFILNDITLVVDDQRPSPDIFTRHADGIWVMDPEIAQELAQLRAEQARSR